MADRNPFLYRLFERGQDKLAQSYLFDSAFEQFFREKRDKNSEEWLILNNGIDYVYGVGIRDCDFVEKTLGLDLAGLGIHGWWYDWKNFDRIMEKATNKDLLPCTWIRVPFSDYIIEKASKYATHKELEKIVKEKKQEIDSLERYYRMFYGSYRDHYGYSAVRAVEKYIEYGGGKPDVKKMIVDLDYEDEEQFKYDDEEKINSLNSTDKELLFADWLFVSW